MSKINLNEKRKVGDSITTTFSFVKQEIVPLSIAFGAIVVPLICLDFYLKSSAVLGILNTLANTSEAGFDTLEKTIASTFTTGVVYVWIHLMIVAYLQVYYEKFRAGDGKRIAVREVWKLMSSGLAKGFFWYVAYAMIVSIGLMLLVIPGIYMGIAMVFTIFFLLIRKKSIDAAISDSGFGN